MVRPLRLEFAGALYHVTSRGDRREDIYLDDDDRQEWLTVLAEVCDRFNWAVHAYCEMSNHYHLLVETIDGNLSRGMRQLNGLYTQRFNRRHKQVGHLFQGRYKAILIQKEAHLLELARYIVLNPVRAGMVSLPEQWHWSSYDFCVRDRHAPPWLDTDCLLGQFGVKCQQARLAYARFVLDGVGLASPLLATRHQLLLGDDEFVEKYQHQLRPEDLQDVSIAHRRAISLPLHAYQENFADRNEAMA
ncbi:REP-associated tyrosine transposase [Undibacterium hunanense]|uniref:REP-associated tyrosine transposase n=1 Tax=Undibacterium hunanense TaxID=2762292 RepID=UPI001C9AE805|nr:transposase [Undibacterium hunanense]